MILELRMIPDLEHNLVQLIFLEQKVFIRCHENRQRICVTVDFGFIVEEKVFVGILLIRNGRRETRPLDVSRHEEKFDFVFALRSEEEYQVEFEIVTFFDVKFTLLYLLEVTHLFGILMLPDLSDIHILSCSYLNRTHNILTYRNVFIFK